MRRTPVSILVLLVLPIAYADAATIVAPSGYGALEGNEAGSFPFTNFEGRYQQAYAASQFASGPLSISEIAFRTDASPATQNRLNELSFTIRLSTSANTVGSLSTTFADNIGVDDTLVYTSPALATHSGINAGGSGPNAFDLVLVLDTPFAYDAANGDLLLEVLMSTNNKLLPLSGISYLDAVESTTPSFDVGVQRVWNSGGDVGATDGDTDLHGYGLVTRFTYTVVPEPGTALLVLAGVLGLAACRRCV